MLKVKKMILGFILVMVISLIFCSSSVLATSANTTNTPRTITPSRVTTDNTANTANTDNTTNTSDEDENTTNTPTSIVGSRNTSTNTSNSAIGSSNYVNNNTANSSSLPYAGTKTSFLFVGIAFVLSAFYAYKKIVEYKNI